MMASSMGNPGNQTSTNNDPPLEVPSNSSIEPIVNETLELGSGGLSTAGEDVARQRRTRGPTLGRIAPEDANKKRTLTILGDSVFAEKGVSSTIVKIIKNYFTGVWPTWRKIPDDVKEAMWKKFGEYFNWPLQEEPNVRRVWEKTCKERLKDTLNGERTKAMKEAGVTNIIDIKKCKGMKRHWMPTEIWDVLIDTVWSTESWQNKSKKALANRLTEKEGSITKHTSGSRSFLATQKLMEEELQRPIHYPELFERTHKRSKGSGDFVDNKSKVVSDKYQSTLSEKYGDNTSDHPEFDPEAWASSIGGKIATRTHVYGFGTMVNSKALFDATSSAAACTTNSVCGPSTSTPHMDVSLNDDRIVSLEQKLESLTDDVSQVKNAVGDISDLKNQFQIMMSFMMEKFGSNIPPPTKEDLGGKKRATKKTQGRQWPRRGNKENQSNVHDDFLFHFVCW
ncbi:uncharacterized protein LOC120251571 isoform X2 [Dioscorea cayenensis subsp. rotundata]|uniref:Uncharacterized protein LOC120251571 isoform X2 n=1 Tax=Dioscorea cayennensis subsp. rotundata TaxID=55577 RepID=A0AB40AM09_DIOCR|nr:uncharacterized protein LOC120251571 isoform X2 [Dioscorea cayenensis subsp. rotundata]